VGAEPKNLDARLALVRAQLETGRRDEAQASLAPVAAVKDARVSFLTGRLLLTQTPPDREKALAAFKEAISRDGKMIGGYLAESTTLAQMARADEALEVLKQAETQASDDPPLMMQLGRAYLALGKPADAEARFRAALEKVPELADARISLGTALEAENKAA